MLSPHSDARASGSNAKRRIVVEPLEGRQFLSVTPSVYLATDATSGYTASQLRAAYNITGTGAGQTIAIVDAYADPTVTADLNTYDAKMGLAAATLSVVSQSGSATDLPATDAGWAMEIALDVEMAHAAAPAARIMLVEANSATLTDLMAGVTYASQAHGVSVISMSWGQSEFYSEASYDSTFNPPSWHRHITYVAASGDSAYAEWPSVSPNVLSVGGTTLSVSDASGTYSSETGWANSGGGYSQFEAEPAFQETVQTSGVRTAPDVSLNADPNSGDAIYDSTPYEGTSGWEDVAGTSAAAPFWAGIIANADQSRHADSLGSLSTLTTQTTLYATYNTDEYALDFHDITSGGNGYFGFGGSFGGGNGATVGYDLLTGLGTPRGSMIVAGLDTASTVVNATKTTGSPKAGNVIQISSPSLDISQARPAVPTGVSPSPVKINEYRPVDEVVLPISSLAETECGGGWTAVVGPIIPDAFTLTLPHSVSALDAFDFAHSGVGNLPIPNDQPIFIKGQSESPRDASREPAPGIREKYKTPSAARPSPVVNETQKDACEIITMALGIGALSAFSSRRSSQSPFCDRVIDLGTEDGV